MEQAPEQIGIRIDKGKFSYTLKVDRPDVVAYIRADIAKEGCDDCAEGWQERDTTLEAKLQAAEKAIKELDSQLRAVKADNKSLCKTIEEYAEQLKAAQCKHSDGCKAQLLRLVAAKEQLKAKDKEIERLNRVLRKFSTMSVQELDTALEGK